MSDSLLLGLFNDLIDAGAKLAVGAAQVLFRGQQGDGRTALSRRFHDLIGRTELEAVGLMAMQARRVQIMVARDLRHRLAAGEAAVDFRALEMLACVTISTHICSEAGES